MKRLSKVLAVLMSLMLIVCAFAACSSEQKAEELYIFNTKGENADAMQKAADQFTAETGIKTKVFSLGSGTDSTEIMRTEMNSKNKPAIFCVMNAQALPEWIESGYARPLNEAITPEFKALVDEIPQSFHLSSDSVTNYGIPFNIEGYGYIVDTEMLSDIFGADGKEVAEAIKTASYEEWEKLVNSLSSYIKNGTEATVSLSGKEFTMVAEKTGKSANLEGVFSTAGSQPWTYGDHMLNVAINSVFAGPTEAGNATAADVEKLTGAFKAYAKALDLKTSNAITARSPEFINNTTNGYDASVENLASGKAVFFKQGNWVYSNFAASSNPEIVDTLSFVPVKLPLEEADVTASGRTVESINQSIPVFVPNYYVINAKATKEEQEWAEKFLVWLNTSESGQKIVKEDMAFIPFNADPEDIDVSNSLGVSIIEYVKSGNTISNPYAGAPTNWSGDTVGQYIMENYLTKAEWTEVDYQDISNYAVTKWIEMAKLK